MAPRLQRPPSRVPALVPVLALSVLLCFITITPLAHVVQAAAPADRRLQKSPCTVPSDFERYNYVPGGATPCQEGAKLQVDQSCTVKRADGTVTSTGPGRTAMFQCTTNGLLPPQYFFFCHVPGACEASVPSQAAGWTCNSASFSREYANGTVCTKPCPSGTSGPGITSTCIKEVWSQENATKCIPLDPRCNPAERPAAAGWECDQSVVNGRLKEGTVCSLKCGAGTFGVQTRTTCSRSRWSNAPGKCTTCTPITGSSGPIVCTSASSSKAGTGFACNSGRYMARGAGTTADTCPACTPIANGAGPITCTSASNSKAGTGFSCNPGWYGVPGSGSSADTCRACTPIANGAGPITCTSANNSKARTGFSCNPGWYRVLGSGSSADTCRACSPIVNGTGSITCTSATSSKASTGFSCNPGRYLARGTGSTADTCAACTPIANSVGPITCTSANSSKASTGFSCNPGRYRSLGSGSAPDTCIACQPVASSTGAITCTSARDSIGAICNKGTYKVNGTVGVSADTCVPCQPVASSTGAITCTSAMDSIGAICNKGTFKVNGTIGASADTCVPCTPILDSTGPITCTNATNSRGDQANGFKCNYAAIGDGKKTPGFKLNTQLEADFCMYSSLSLSMQQPISTQDMYGFNLTVNCSTGSYEAESGLLYRGGSPDPRLCIVALNSVPTAGAYLELTGQYFGRAWDQNSNTLTTATIQAVKGANSTTLATVPAESWMRYSTFFTLYPGESITLKLSLNNPDEQAFVEFQLFGFNLYPNPPI